MRIVVTFSMIVPLLLSCVCVVFIIIVQIFSAVVTLTVIASTSSQVYIGSEGRKAYRYRTLDDVSESDIIFGQDICPLRFSRFVYSMAQVVQILTHTMLYTSHTAITHSSVHTHALHVADAL